VNLYAYVGNNSVMFVDLMGTEKTLIIWFMWKEDSNYGWEVWLDYGNSWSLTMLNYFSDTNTVKAYKSDHFWNSVDEALNYINNKEFNKIIILWHSLWWDNAINLVNKLDSNNINVELLITLDIKSFYENDTITNNVNYAYNYHQSIDESSNLHWIRVLDWEDIEKSLFNNNSNIKNMNIESYNWHKISHTNIDDLLVDEVVKIINNHK
jgi:hypothetical protein